MTDDAAAPTGLPVGSELGPFYAQLGLVPLPLPPAMKDQELPAGGRMSGKAPCIPRCDNCRAGADKAERAACHRCGWRMMTRAAVFPYFNRPAECGLLCGEHQDSEGVQILVVDLDPAKPNEVDGVAWLRQHAPDGWRDQVGWIVATPSKGMHLYFRFEPGVGTGTRVVLEDGRPVAVDVRSTGGQVVGPGSFNGARNAFYRPEKGHGPNELDPAHFPLLSQSWVAPLMLAAEGREPPARRRRLNPDPPRASRHDAPRQDVRLPPLLRFTAADLADVRQALTMIGAHRLQDRSGWVAVGNILRTCEDSPRMYDLWAEHSRRAPGFRDIPDAELRATWETLGLGPVSGAPLTVGSLFAWALEDDPCEWALRSARQIYDKHDGVFWGDHRFWSSSSTGGR